MTRPRLLDSAGLVFLVLAAWLWWVGFPDPVESPITPPDWVRSAPDAVPRATRGILAAMLGTSAIAAFGVLIIRRRAPQRVVVVAPALLLLAGLAGIQIVRGLGAAVRAGEPTGAAPSTLPLDGFAPTAAAAATAVGLTGVALLLADLVRRPRAAAAGLLAVVAVALLADQGARWLIAGVQSPVGFLWPLATDTLVGVILAAGALALAAGLQRAPGTLVREAAVGATVLWGAVVLASALLPVYWWQRLLGDFRDPEPAGLGPYVMGAVTLLCAPAAAILVARVSIPATPEVVTMRWRGACAALALLLLDRVAEPVGPLLLAARWPAFTAPLILWLVLSAAVATGFAVAAVTSDGAPWICVAAALLSVSSAAVVEGVGGAETGLPEPFVLGMLVPLAVAIALPVHARRARNRVAPAADGPVSQG